MVKRVLALTTLILLVGCAASSDSSMHCASDVRRGTCTITYAFLEGTFASRDIVDEDWRLQASGVDVSCHLTVDTGSVRAWFEDPNGVKHEAVVSPGAPATLAGTARMANTGDKKVVTLYFEPIGDGNPRAENLVVVVDYDMP